MTPLNDTETSRLIALWEQDRVSRNLTTAQRTELASLASRITAGWPPYIRPPGTIAPTIIIPKPSIGTMIAGDPGVMGPLV